MSLLWIDDGFFFLIERPPLQARKQIHSPISHKDLQLLLERLMSRAAQLLLFKPYAICTCVYVHVGSFLRLLVINCFETECNYVFEAFVQAKHSLLWFVDQSAMFIILKQEAGALARCLLRKDPNGQLKCSQCGRYVHGASCKWMLYEDSGCYVPEQYYCPMMSSPRKGAGRRGASREYSCAMILMAAWGASFSLHGTRWFQESLKFKYMYIAGIEAWWQIKKWQWLALLAIYAFSSWIKSGSPMKRVFKKRGFGL